MTTFIMGIDQYGEHYDDLGKYPRKELLRRLGYKLAQKMYQERITTGETVCGGYVIGNRWITLYSVSPLEIKQ